MAGSAGHEKGVGVSDWGGDGRWTGISEFTGEVWRVRKNVPEVTYLEVSEHFREFSGELVAEKLSEPLSLATVMERESSVSQLLSEESSATDFWWSSEAFPCS
jgi:hypothetical protein